MQSRFVLVLNLLSPMLRTIWKNIGRHIGLVMLLRIVKVSSLFTIEIMII